MHTQFLALVYLAGLGYHYKKYREKGFQYLDEAKGLLGKISEPGYVAMFYSCAGALYKVDGKLSQAKSCLEKASKLYLESGNERLYWTSKMHLSYFVFKSGRVDECMKILDEARRFFEGTNDKLFLFVTHWNIGVAHGRLGRYSEQVENWEQAVALKKELGLPFQGEQIKLEEAQRRISQV